MKKILLLCMALCLFSGCSKKVSEDATFHNTYNSFVDSIMDNGDAQSSNIPFNHTLHVEKDKNGNYSYEILIDQPQIAMYNVQMMIVDKSTTDLYPFLGLRQEETLYSMIPNQENKDNGFVKGIVLGGISTSPKFTLYVQVSWKDYAQVNTQSVFFHYTYDYEKDHPQEEEGNVEE